MLGENGLEIHQDLADRVGEHFAGGPALTGIQCINAGTDMGFNHCKCAAIDGRVFGRRGNVHAAFAAFTLSAFALTFAAGHGVGAGVGLRIWRFGGWGLGLFRRSGLAWGRGGFGRLIAAGYQAAEQSGRQAERS